MFHLLKNVITASGYLLIAAFGAGVPSFDISARAPNRNEGPLRPPKETTMSYSISTLMLRNLRDVFGENDPVRRRAAIDEIYNEDGVFYGKKPAYTGTDFVIARNGRIAAVYLFFDGPDDPTRRNGPAD